MARLVAINADTPGKVYPLTQGECLLGRRLDCHICIPDQRVSRRHTRIRREGDGWQVEDLGSCNGTFVNGRKVLGAARLRHDDEIEVGASKFRIDLADELESAAQNAAVLVGEGLDHTVSIASAELTQLGVFPRRTGGAPLERELEQAQRKLQAMYRVSETLAGTLEPQALLDKLVAQLLEVFPQASVVAAVTFDPRTQLPRTQAAKKRRPRDEDTQAGVAIPRAVVERVIRQGNAVLLRAPSEGREFGELFSASSQAPHETMVIKNPLAGISGASILPVEPLSAAVGWRMGAPLMFRGESMGILHVEAEPALGFFTQDDLDLLGGVCAQASVGLHLIGLHQKNLARERLDYDLRLARQIQRNLLPRDVPKLAGLEFAVHYEPAFHVGGDFYDFLYHDPQRLSVVVGDVSGKAISGALFMARVTNEIRAAAPMEQVARKVLSRVNRSLAEVAEDGMFVTMLYATVDVAASTLRFANAGHTIALLRRAGQVAQLEYDEARTLPLGIDDELSVAEAVVKLVPGDVLLLYTDGLIEARSMSGEFYGQERLERAFGAGLGSARETLEAVLADLDRFVEDAPQADDQTVVCFVYSP
ncbi:MAG: SpoIIE family protein phosphatase [Myxococcales bacterium]|nr:SpoIIE family protein phosphatase [Myxococcales bacterium]